MYSLYEQIEQKAAAILDAGTSDELFASGYLSGHLSLALAQCEQKNTLSEQDFKKQVESGLAQAFTAKELTPPDQVLVQEMWAFLSQP
ncbi:MULTISPECIES: YfcL family protein [unclassified Motilimonas]|uniref:YfcL family protein n=1 Tax=Motilimonas TaxID=1914248 RepID=UPI001E3D0E9C|nr:MULTISPECIES: YfcL family protein [unclassified Motilimonas]MCE0556743.1 YfcL family protein [Motilimonas sp. E26]MDO6526790.1 YfcL family protein [Motilimonas sp. 1_MG-2023]